MVTAGIGVYLIKETSRFGACLHADSFYYLTGADQLARSGEYGPITGIGEFRPTTHFLPMLSLVIALANRFGFDTYPAARIVTRGNGRPPVCW
jgi:hypothetical protein